MFTNIISYCKSCCLLVSVFIGLLFVSTDIEAQANSQQANDIPQLTDNGQISLLTCSSGDELYSVFGHSAIRVLDDSLDIDIVLNYGTFDFNTPNFYLKFMKGDLNYMLSASAYKRFIYIYDYEGRGVTESVLNLDKQQKQELWNFLVWNIKPENRNYRYDFFFDNCATRIRDIVFKTKGISEESVRNSSVYNTNSLLSFRDYIHSYVPESTWTAQGIDLLLGMKTDKPADIFDRAYLPVYLDSLFMQTDIIKSQKEILPRDTSSAAEEGFVFTPNNLGWLLLVLSIWFTSMEFTKKVYYKWFDVVFFISCALLSLLFWSLWLFTKHVVCSDNLNVLWASILYWPIVVMLFRRRLPSSGSFGFKFITCSAYINIALLVAFILLSIFNVQDTPSMSILISLALILRNVQLSKYVANVSKKK